MGWVSDEGDLRTQAGPAASSATGPVDPASGEVVGGFRSVPGTTLLPVFTPGTVLARRGHVVLGLDAGDIALQDPHQPTGLLGRHGLQRRHDQLGLLGLDEVMEFHATLRVAGGLPIEHGIAAELDLVEVGCQGRVGRAGRGLEIHDPSAFPDEVDDADERRQAGGDEISLDPHFDGLGFLIEGHGCVGEVMLKELPGHVPLFGFLVVPVDAVLGLVHLPVFGEHRAEGFQVGGFSPPAAEIPLLEDGMDDLADEQRRRRGRLDPGDVAEEELQPALGEEPQPGGRDVFEDAGFGRFRFGDWDVGSNGKAHRPPPFREVER